MDFKYKGMTVNERLYVSGLLNVFDKAIKKRDIEKVVAILKEVEITDKPETEAILKEFGLSEKSQINNFFCEEL
ncbi:MAG: hypothetical protein Q4G63_07920 [Bacteroidia bacterium]|nr:hypothetical protein [Bacteroidia bacterium]